MTLQPEEPEWTRWRAVDDEGLVAEIWAAIGSTPGRPGIVAIDGRGASGKSTVASRIATAVTGAVVVHTDDVAWHESFFGWGDLMSDHVLRVLHQGRDVRFRPRAWQERGREGAIEVPATASLVIVEGVGASQIEFAGLIDVTLWVQSDFVEAERRGIARDISSGVNGDRAQTIAFWHAWMEQEIEFLRRQRPWERAAVIVAGTPVMDLADGEWAVADGPVAST